ncbi:hypothetical protein CHCC20333_1874 [Bacillus paralicheniformis]|nr:hypothetical protein LI7559_19640 [Bacillus licheniformis LMG 7559]TWK82916.1 hypothetical protein CHCC20333_1874 [Bacillus paralicheniformis]
MQTQQSLTPYSGGENEKKAFRGQMIELKRGKRNKPKRTASFG